jgi:serine/threonine protein kinase
VGKKAVTTSFQTLPMSYCPNPDCSSPENPDDAMFCEACGSFILLQERFRPLSPLARGGFSRTFLAEDIAQSVALDGDDEEDLKALCVVKQFYIPFEEETDTIQKAFDLFKQESQRLIELQQHPQIPQLLAYFEQDKHQYLVQEYIDGDNLDKELWDKGPFNALRIRQLLSEVLSILEFVHSHQVIHRDIKPENIIRRRFDGRMFLVDFGAAKLITATTFMRKGTQIGTMDYASPEQLLGKAIFASDIYSLGVTCIHLLTQMAPKNLFDVNNEVWMWEKYAVKPVTDGLTRIINHMLAKAPVDRYTSATEVLEDVRILPK